VLDHRHFLLFFHLSVIHDLLQCYDLSLVNMTTCVPRVQFIRAFYDTFFLLVSHSIRKEFLPALSLRRRCRSRACTRLRKNAYRDFVTLRLIIVTLARYYRATKVGNYRGKVSQRYKKEKENFMANSNAASLTSPLTCKRIYVSVFYFHFTRSLRSYRARL